MFSSFVILGQKNALFYLDFIEKKMFAYSSLQKKKG